MTYEEMVRYFTPAQITATLRTIRSILEARDSFDNSQLVAA